MFSLAEQIGGADFAINCLVSDHHRLGRPGEQIDADPAEQLALGFGHEGITRAHQDIDRADARSADRHGADGLNATEAIDFICPRHSLRRDDCSGQLSLEGRRAGDDARHTRHLGSDHAHVRRCEEGILAAGDIAARVLHRDGLVAQDNTRQRLDFSVGDRGALDLREVAHLGLGEFDVVNVLRA